MPHALLASNRGEPRCTSVPLPLDTALVATGAGFLFTGIGFLLMTDYRGGRRWILGRAEASLDDVPLVRDPLQRFNTRFFFGGDPERFTHFKAHVMPLVLGGAFMIMGSLALLIGLLSLLVLLVQAL